jgi:hypothetical protein
MPAMQARSGRLAEAASYPNSQFWEIEPRAPESKVKTL